MKRIHPKREGGLRGARADRRQNGNVLFLILIAVALFAALSYAVTQSSRSGSGDANSEKNLVSGAEITQYPAGVRTAIVRMVISNNISVDQLYFDPPSSFASVILSADDQKRDVFHPAGGGATFQNAPTDVMDGSGMNPTGNWYFNALFSIPNIGTTSASSDTSGNDLIAFLPGVKQSVCQKIDDSLGLASIPTLASALSSGNLTSMQKSQAKGTGTYFTVFATTSGISLGVAELSGQPFACFHNGSSGAYIYYHTLIER